MDYSNLWKLLIDKSMSKTDLLEVTGISSRVLAKLSKNQTVTTDTLARICAALDCRVEDIMECVSEEQLSVYGHFKKYGVCTEKNEQYQTVRFSVGDQPYTVYVSRQTATRASRIHCCEDGCVRWEQVLPIGTFTVNKLESLLIKPVRQKDEIAIVLIKGKPYIITGLDEGGFVSARGTLKKNSDILVMSEAAFKLFQPK